MPIRIDRLAPDGRDNETVAWLCDGCWRLPDQCEALEVWLAEHRGGLPAGEYRADIGFSQRDDACGGRGAFSPAGLRRMADLNMTLWLSEYYGTDDGPPADDCSSRGEAADAEPGAAADGGAR